MGPTVTAAIFDLNHPAHYVHWHFFQMSVPNVVVFAVMLFVFALAIALPFPGAHVASWTYVLGLAAVAALVVIVGSGIVLSLKGLAWWHYTSAGRFFNSIHLWAVELFFFTMVIHLWGKFWMAAWRGGRARVWVTGAVTFLIAIPAALTGYISQQNFDAQWISIQAKDAMNSIGAGAFFNVMDFGQMYGYHVLIFPIAVFALVLAHLLLVRHHGVAPPLELDTRRVSMGISPGGAPLRPAPASESHPSVDRAPS